MGCSQSKIEDEEAVSRCKDRKRFMKSAVAARNAFSAAHCSAAVALKNTGAAFNDFIGGEVANPHPPSSSTTASALPTVATTLPSPPRPPIQTLPPPPPPIPDMPLTPLQRAVSMPEFAVSKSSKPVSEPTIVEEDEEEEEEEEEEDGSLRRRRRRENKGGSIGGRVESTASAVEPPPSLPPEENRIPPTPPEPGISTWVDYFTAEVPYGSLGGVEEVRSERKENERKVFDERPNRAAAKSSGERAVEAMPTPESMVEEKPPFTQNGGKGLKKGKQQVVGSTASGGGAGEVKRRNVNLVQLFTDLDNYFLAASECAQDVTKLLEATRLHYHSNFADSRGHIDHSARVMRVITWNKSFRGLPNAEEFRDDFDCEEDETHATVLDKLLAWEKKLYDEVKASEIMKFEYQRKVALLNKQKQRGAKSESLEKLKAAVSHLHTRYIVDMQSLDSTVLEINRLRDKQLYPKLVALIDAMATMWDAMQGYHQKQLNIAAALKAVDISQSTKETTAHLHERTIQLWGVVQEWHMQFDRMVNFQKEYIRALNSWLKLSLIPIESNLKEKVSSPLRAQNPPIQGLLLAWHDLLAKLPDEHTKGTIYNFSAVLHTIVQQQEDELKLRTKVEESTRDLEKKHRHYNKWLKDARSGEDRVPKEEIMVEKELAVENAKRKLEEYEENYQRQCRLVREKSLTNLKTRMPELFRALSDFALGSSDMYRNLKAICDSESHQRRATEA